MTTNSNTFDPGSLQGVDVMGADGSKLGTVDAVYLDDATSQPQWVAVATEGADDATMVPLATAQFDGERLTVPYDDQQLRDAPHHDPSGRLTPKDEQDLYRHFGVGGDREDRAAPYVVEDRDKDDALMQERPDPK
ncbi:PRC-barrel domain-containing protein [Flexivirga lutea]